MPRNNFQSEFDVCRICSSKNINLLFRKKNRAFFQCDSCDVAYFIPPPSVSELNDHYYMRSIAGNYEQKFSNDRFSNDNDVFFFIKKYIKQKSEIYIFDVGCLYGQLLDIAAANGFKTYGIEPQQKAVQVALSKHPNRIYQSTVEAFCPDQFGLNNKFHVVVASGVIEHVLEPHSLFRLASMLLAENGIFVLQTPNHNSFVRKISGKIWPCYAVPEHPFYFAPKTLVLMGAKHGFSKLSIKPHVKWLRVSYVFRQLEFFGDEIFRTISPFIRLVPTRLKDRRMPFYAGEMLVKLEKNM